VCADGKGEVLQTASLRINKPKHMTETAPSDSSESPDADSVGAAAGAVDPVEFSRTAFRFWHQSIEPVLEVLRASRGMRVTPRVSNLF